MPSHRRLLGLQGFFNQPAYLLKVRAFSHEMHHAICIEMSTVRPADGVIGFYPFHRQVHLRWSSRVTLSHGQHGGPIAAQSIMPCCPALLEKAARSAQELAGYLRACNADLVNVLLWHLPPGASFDWRKGGRSG